MKRDNFEPMFPSLYTQGYTAALQDVLKVFENIQKDLKYHKIRQCYKTYKAVVECMLENRTILREVPNTFVRHNNATEEFEVWTQGE